MKNFYNILLNIFNNPANNFKKIKDISTIYFYVTVMISLFLFLGIFSVLLVNVCELLFEIKKLSLTQILWLFTLVSGLGSIFLAEDSKLKKYFYCITLILMIINVNRIINLYLDLTSWGQQIFINLFFIIIIYLLILIKRKRDTMYITDVIYSRLVKFKLINWFLFLRNCLILQFDKVSHIKNLKDVWLKLFQITLIFLVASFFFNSFFILINVVIITMVITKLKYLYINNSFFKKNFDENIKYLENKVNKNTVVISKLKHFFFKRAYVTARVAKLGVDNPVVGKALVVGVAALAGADFLSTEFYNHRGLRNYQINVEAVNRYNADLATRESIDQEKYREDCGSLYQDYLDACSTNKNKHPIEPPKYPEAPKPYQRQPAPEIFNPRTTNLNQAWSNLGAIFRKK